MNKKETDIYNKRCDLRSLLRRFCELSNLPFDDDDSLKPGTFNIHNEGSRFAVIIQTNLPETYLWPFTDGLAGYSWTDQLISTLTTAIEMSQGKSDWLRSHLEADYCKSA